MDREWGTVCPQIRDMVRSDVKTRYSIDPARFITHGEDGEEKLGPDVVWVGVYLDTTSPTLPTKTRWSRVARVGLVAGGRSNPSTHYPYQ